MRVQSDRAARGYARAVPPKTTRIRLFAAIALVTWLGAPAIAEFVFGRLIEVFRNLRGIESMQRGRHMRLKWMCARRKLISYSTSTVESAVQVAESINPAAPNA